MQKIILFGSKSQARINHQMILDGLAGKSKVHCIFDPSSNSAPFTSEAIFCNDKSKLATYLSEVTHFIICIGNEYGILRCLIHEELVKLNIKPLSLISNHSIVDNTVQYGEGLQTMPGSIIHKFTSIGKQCIINTNATVDHECQIGEGVHIMGGATLAGRIQVGKYASIGTNATILPDLKIEEGSFVGAGAVVTKDIPPYTIVAGVPATYLKKNNNFYDNSILQCLQSL